MRKETKIYLNRELGYVILGFTCDVVLLNSGRLCWGDFGLSIGYKNYTGNWALN